MTASLVAVMMLAAQPLVHAQMMTAAPAKTTKPVKKHKETPEEIQLREMRESLAKQQAQIDALQQQLATKTSDAATAQQTATDAQAQAAAAAASAAQAAAAAAAASTKVDAVSSSVTDLKTTTAGLTETVLANQTKVKEEIESPTAIHYKGITITPVAFFAAEGVWRQHSVNSDINTPFNSHSVPERERRPRERAELLRPPEPPGRARSRAMRATTS